MLAIIFYIQEIIGKKEWSSTECVLVHFPLPFLLSLLLLHLLSFDIHEEAPIPQILALVLQKKKSFSWILMLYRAIPCITKEIFILFFFLTTAKAIQHGPYQWFNLDHLSFVFSMVAFRVYSHEIIKWRINTWWTSIFFCSFESHLNPIRLQVSRQELCFKTFCKVSQMYH